MAALEVELREFLCARTGITRRPWWERPTIEDDLRLFLQRPRPTAHVHPCPSCYEDVPCAHLDCAIEPDLVLDNGLPAGAHALCGTCMRRGSTP